MPTPLRLAYSWLDEATWQRYEPRLQRLEVPAKTVLLREGVTASRLYYLEQGCVRSWFEGERQAITTQFFFEGQPFASLESFTQHTPSLFTFETIEPSVLYWLTKADAQLLAAELAGQRPFLAAATDFLLHRQQHYMREFLSFLKHSPAQRYQTLLAERPELVQRVPAQYIASYLGITPVSLSRLKARLARQG